MRRIICIGNRYVPEDAAGPLVYERLRGETLPDDVELVDGGLAGLSLLRLLEQVERVVFVDRAVGLGAGDGIVVLDAARVAALAEGSFGHSAGLPYLLRVLPAVCEGPLPQIWVVGVESGKPEEERTIEEAASLALKLAVHGGTEGCSRSREPQTE
jgi:hydrogenase maturation protease